MYGSVEKGLLLWSIETFTEPCPWSQTLLTTMLPNKPKIKLLWKPVNNSSKIDLLHLFELASKTPWEKQLCYPFKENDDISKTFFSTVGISPCSAGALFYAEKRCCKISVNLGTLKNRKQAGVYILIPLSLSPKNILRTKIAQTSVTVTIPRLRQVPNRTAL